MDLWRVGWFIVFLASFAHCANNGDRKKFLKPPRKVMAKVVSSDTLEVRWRDPAAKGQENGRKFRKYLVRYVPEGERKAMSTIQTTDRKVTISGLKPGKTYVISVKAIRGRKPSSWSRKIKVTLSGEFSEHENVVQNITAVPISSDAILLSWVPPPNSDDVIALTIITERASGSGNQRKSVLTNQIREYTAKNLRPHLIYSFRIQTMQKLAPHPISRRVYARPFSDVPGKPPKYLRLKLYNSTMVQAKWQPPPARARNGQLTGFSIQYKRMGSRKGDLCTITTEKRIKSYQLTDLVANSTYKVRVAAMTINGTGPYTKWSRIVVEGTTEEEDLSQGSTINPFLRGDIATLDLSPSPPSELKITNKTGSTVHIVWPVPRTPTCCPVVAYRVQVRLIKDSSVKEIVRGSPYVKLIDLEPSTQYGVKVSTLNTAGESEPSRELLFYTDGPVAPTLTYTHNTTVLLGGDANLTCQAEGEELPTFSWYIKDGERKIPVPTIPQATGFSSWVVLVTKKMAYNLVTSSILVYNVTKSDDITFGCVAENNGGVVAEEVVMTTYDPPKVIESRGMTVMVDTPSRLQCKVQGRPIPTVVWVHQSTGVVYDESTTLGSSRSAHYVNSLVLEEGVRQTNLVLSRTSLQWSGTYLCVARSVAGRAESKVVLEARVPPPPQVESVNILVLSPTKLTVNWEPPREYSFNIYYYQVTSRKKDGGQTTSYNTTHVSMDLTNLEPNTTYLIGVTAATKERLGASGPEEEATTLSDTGHGPVNINATMLNETVLHISWEAPKALSPAYIRGYNIYYKFETSDLYQTGFVIGPYNTDYTIVVFEDRTYQIKVATVLTWGKEAATAWVTIKTTLAQPPPQPVNVTATAREEEIMVTWDKPELRHRQAEITGYKIIYGPFHNPSQVEVVNVSPDVTEYTIQNLEPGARFLISLSAINDQGSSQPVYLRISTIDSPPSRVRNVLARGVSSTEIHVSWDPPAKGRVSRYHVRYWRPGRRGKESAWLSGSSQTYRVASLDKNANYRFEIIPYDGEKLGEGFVIFTHTLTDRPDGPPTNIVLTPLNATSLLVSWDPPEPDLANGVIVGYRLKLKVKKGPNVASFVVPAPQRNYTFLNLDVSKPYKLRISALTSNGSGVASKWVEPTFTATPQKPGPPENLSIIPGRNTLSLSWDPPKFTGSPVTGYIVGHGKFIPEVFKDVLDQSHTSHVIKKLKPATRYMVSVRAFNAIGQSEPAFMLASTTWKDIDTTPLEMPERLTVTSLSASSLGVTWTDPVVEKWKEEGTTLNDRRMYLIRYSPISGEAYAYVNTTEESLILTDLQPATLYEVSVKVMRGDDSSSWTLPVLNSTKQIAPSSSPTNINVWLPSKGSTELHLSWSEPEFPNGKIEGYVIYMSTDPTADRRDWVVHASFVRNAAIKHINPHTPYFFKLQARNKAGYGPLSSTVVYQPESDPRAAPSGLQVLGLWGKVASAVKVTWQPPEVPLSIVTGYVLYYSDDLGPYKDWAVQTENGPDSVILGLMFNTTYFFKVQARHDSSFGPWSDTINFTTPVDARAIQRAQSISSTSSSKKFFALSAPEEAKVERSNDTEVQGLNETDAILDADEPETVDPDEAHDDDLVDSVIEENDYAESILDTNDSVVLEDMESELSGEENSQNEVDGIDSKTETEKVAMFDSVIDFMHSDKVELFALQEEDDDKYFQKIDNYQGLDNANVSDSYDSISNIDSENEFDQKVLNNNTDDDYSYYEYDELDTTDVEPSGKDNDRTYTKWLFKESSSNVTNLENIDSEWDDYDYDDDDEDDDTENDDVIHKNENIPEDFLEVEIEDDEGFEINTNFDENENLEIIKN